MSLAARNHAELLRTGSTVPFRKSSVTGQSSHDPGKPAAALKGTLAFFQPLSVPARPRVTLEINGIQFGVLAVGDESQLSRLDHVVPSTNNSNNNRSSGSEACVTSSGGYHCVAFLEDKVKLRASSIVWCDCATHLNHLFLQRARLAGCALHVVLPRRLLEWPDGSSSSSAHG